MSEATTILVVDDDPDIRETVADVLQDEGYQIEVAATKQRGWVHGQVSARGFTVAEEDTSWCVFFMRRFHGTIADGEYTCYMNGGIADQGTFKLMGTPAPADEGAPVKPST